MASKSSQVLVPSPASASRSLAARPTVQRSRRTRDVDHRSGRGSAKRTLTTANVQHQLIVGAAADPFEREAERTADAMTFGDGAPASVFDDAPLASSLLRVAQRATGKAEEPAKKNDEEKERQAQKAASTAGGPDVVPRGLEASVQSMSAGGQSLEAAIRSSFETRFGFDFSAVRVHTGTMASSAAMALSARAFTVGDHIFFGSGEYQPSSATGRRLIAHELTHTIQQKPGAARAARLLAAPRRVQRLVGDAKEAMVSKVRNWISRDFPPWDLITLLIGHDPIKGVSVKGSTRDFIRAALKLVPDGEALFQKLDTEGKVDAIAKWWDAQIATLDLTYGKIVALVEQAWDAVGPADLFDHVGAYEKKIKPIFQPVVNRVWDFAKAVGAKILQVVRDVVLRTIGEWAQKQKGYPLLTMVLGRDPVTGEEVKPTLKGVIFAVLDLVPGGDKIKENLEKSKTVEKAAAWFQAEVKKLKLSWETIKLLFAQAWEAFKVADLLNPRTLFEKMAMIFGPPVSRLLAFLAAVGKKILEFIFEGAMLIAGPIGLQIVGIIRKVGDTFHRIIEDPVAFVGHLVNAVKKGIQQFAKNIWEHLKAGLINWLVGTLEGAGLVLPKVWDLRGILDLVLQVLGITYAKVRVKLVKATSEKTVSMLETGFAFIKTLVTEGPAAAWREIVGAIGSLWDMVIGGIKDWAVTKIVTAAITKLATMLNPAGAVIQAIIATYNTIAFFIERIRQILAFVEAVVDSIANIATGKIAQAANWIETAMARTIPVILGFLARLIGLGDVSGAITKVITAIQEKVDKAIDSVIKWVVDKAKSLFGGKDAADPKAVGKHQALLKALVPRLEEDEAGPPTTDEAWIEARRAKAAQLAAEGQGQLESGVKLTVTVKPTAIPRQLAYDMAIAPNTSSLSGASTPPTLTVGENYAYFVDFTGASRPGLGRFKEAAQLGGQWVIKLIPPGERETERGEGPNGMRGKWKGLVIVPAHKPDGSSNYRLAGAASAEPPVFRLTNSRKTIRGGLQPIDVEAEPLALTAQATKPYQAPPGLERILAPLRSSGAWVPGHLVNGQMGGPGSNENLAPIPIGVNAKMRGGPENTLRAELQKGFYFFFHAHIDYHSAGPKGRVGRTDDFVSSLALDYQEIEKVGATWKRIGAKSTASFSVDVPAEDHLDPARVAG